jgi:hypothetical protein
MGQMARPSAEQRQPCDEVSGQEMRMDDVRLKFFDQLLKLQDRVEQFLGVSERYRATNVVRVPGDG